MNKKKMPRAIRPEAAPAAGKPSAAASARVTEPWEELNPKPAAAKAKKAAPEPADDTPEGRRAAAVKLVKRYALYSGVGGLLPVPFVDIIAVSGVQMQMLRKLSQIYDVPFSKNRGKAIIAGLAGTFIPASSGIGAASLFKTVPLVGTSIGALTMPTLAVGATYAIGMAFIQHFASGGTLLDFDPPDYREFIKAQKSVYAGRK
jgi:uncharacterized protein (DUF697 family)